MCRVHAIGKYLGSPLQRSSLHLPGGGESPVLCSGCCLRAETVYEIPSLLKGLIPGSGKDSFLCVVGANNDGIALMRIRHLCI
jgi:hypothetical protein